MKKNVTKDQLLRWGNELDGWGSSIVKEFLSSKIQDFYNRNGIRIQTIRDRYRVLYMNHFLHEKNQKGELIQVFDGEGENKLPRLTGITTEEQYQKSVKDFLSEETVYEY